MSWGGGCWRPVVAALLGGFCLLAAVPAVAADYAPSGSDFGGAGLLQTRNARFFDDGTLTLGTSLSYPADRYFLNFTALPWLEATFRFSGVQNLSQNFTHFTDRSFDIKFQLVEESDLLPQVALGFQDFLGTGLYSAEYLVASKRYYDWDFSFGIGWGALASFGDAPNPFGLVEAFKARNSRVGEGGIPLLSNYFRGEDLGFFGGVEYATPVDGLSLKLEWSSDDQRRLVRKFDQRTRLNAGLAYRPYSWLDTGLAFENGSEVMMRAAINLDTKARNRPAYDFPPDRVTPRPAVPVAKRGIPVELVAAGLPPARLRAEPAPPLPPDRRPAVAERLRREIGQQGFFLVATEFDSGAVTLFVDNLRYAQAVRNAGRVLRAAADALPADIELITVVQIARGMEIHRLTIHRRELEKAANWEGSAEEIWGNARSEAGTAVPAAGAVDFAGQTYPNFGWLLAPKLRQHLMDPDQPYSFDLMAAAVGLAELMPGTLVTGAIGRSLVGNIDDLVRQSDSQLPHVRSDVSRYVRADAPIIRLEFDQFWNFAPDWYARASGGLLEEMFAGVGGEVLYRPRDARWAAGLDLNHVWQRDFDQHFGLLDYSVTTGHASLYYDIPYYDLLAQVSAGRYLAGDWGATFQLSRRLRSGIEVGAFATFTNVPFEVFGEGSFDKGIFVSIPFDAFAPFVTRAVANYVIRSLTRDGGQRLDHAYPLYGMTAEGRTTRLMRDWDRILE